MFRPTAIIRELVLNLAKVIFMLKHSVKLRRYMLFGDVAACCHITNNIMTQFYRMFEHKYHFSQVQ